MTVERPGEVNEAILMRTLFLAGFTTTAVTRGANQLEIRCERRDLLGATVMYGIALTDLAMPPSVEMQSFRDEVVAEGRVVVAIAPLGGDNWLGWNEVLEALGGAVPSWRALDGSYAGVLLTASKNEAVAGFDQEGWSVFEQAVADGLEFVLGIKVRRHGGLKRGRKVSDILAETSDERVLVVDAKASANAFDVSAETLRQLTEYVLRAKTHQRGGSPVGAALVVAREFQQESKRLSEIADEFLAETQVPLSLMTTDVLLAMIERLKTISQVRRALPWRQIFCRGGLVAAKVFEQEVMKALEQRIGR